MGVVGGGVPACMVDWRRGLTEDESRGASGSISRFVRLRGTVPMTVTPDPTPACYLG